MARLDAGDPARVALALALAVLTGCSGYTPFDSTSQLRAEYAKRIGERAADVEVPFELDPELAAYVDGRLGPGPDDEDKVVQVLDLIFRGVELHYALVPTRNANQTFRAREGNCISFVNLFVGVARRIRLDPFYVEVQDLQRWSHRDGMVVSQGHIVAGMYVRGELRTYDFLPYRPKAYRNFKPIDDLAAAAHYFNNLGAEALMMGEGERAQELLELAHAVAPTFTKAINNLGVAAARSGDRQRAEAIYREGLEVEPTDVPILTNLARLYQEQGRLDDATAIFERVDVANNTNPYFFIFQGEMALARGEHQKALEYMRQALRRESELPEVHVGLAKVFLAAGDLASARHHIDRALKLDATHAEARRYAALLAAQKAP